jgi:hypothetical protein
VLWATLNQRTITSMKPFRAALIAVTLFGLAALPGSAAKKPAKTPAGVKVVSGSAFDVFVVHKESKPFAQTGWVLSIFESTVVVHNTRKHGRQLIRSRVEAIDADLLDPAMWQVGDFNGDGSDDYRSVSQITKKGCRIWATQTWLPDRERFTFAAKIEYRTDASGKPVKVCR